MTYLVDANVLSEPTKPDPNPKVVDWLQRHERELAVDPIILGEVRFGILLLPPGRQRAKLAQWFEEGVQRLQCLPGRPKPACNGRPCSPGCARRAG